MLDVMRPTMVFSYSREKRYKQGHRTCGPHMQGFLKRIRMKSKKLKPIHPGEILEEEFLKPFHLSQNRLSLSLGVPPRRINEIVLGKRRITADTALRLARYFGSSAQFWLNLEMQYELDVAVDSSEGKIEQRIVPMKRAA